MNILAVDDDHLALLGLKQAILEAEPNCELSCFSTSAEALAHAAENPVEVAFLDIEIDGLNGLSLAKRLKDIHGPTNIIFVTAYSQYSLDAFLLRASGYLRKPVSARDISAELENLRHPLPGPVQGEGGVRIQCFGNFEIFVDGRPVPFRRLKAKETLAYLIDRKGAAVTTKELSVILWEDSNYTRTRQSHLQMIIRELCRALDEAGAGHILIRGRNSLALDISAVDCDYYNFEKGDVAAINSYRGEYLANYSWAEFTASWLEKKMQGHSGD